ncbi:MAG: hypothetical protein ACREXR_23470 [Gammaproteobacteria bacterium]
MNITRYIEEMSIAMKIVLGTIFVVVVGFILTSGEESAQEKQSMTYMMGRQITVDFARETCTKNIKDHLSSDIGYPTQSETDAMATTATLTWQGKDKEFNSIVCNYHKDKGLTSLRIDGVEKFGALSADAGSESEKTAEPEKAAEEPAVDTKAAEVR